MSLLDYIKSFFVPTPIPTPTSARKSTIKSVKGTQRPESNTLLDKRGKSYTSIETETSIERDYEKKPIQNKMSDLDNFDLHQIANPLPKKSLKKEIYQELKIYWASNMSAGGVVKAKKGVRGYSLSTVEKYWSAINRANIKRTIG